MMSTVRSNRPFYRKEDKQYKNNTTYQNEKNSQFIDKNNRCCCETCWCCECCGLLTITIFIIIFSFLILMLEILGIYYAKEITNPPVKERIIRIIFCFIDIICIIIIKIYEKKGDKICKNFSIILSIFSFILAFIAFNLNFVGCYTQLYDYKLINSYLDCNFNFKCKMYNSIYDNDEGYSYEYIYYENGKTCSEVCANNKKKYNELNWRNKDKINDIIEKDSSSGLWKIKSSSESTIMLVHGISAYLWIANLYFFIIMIIRMFISNDNPPEPEKIPAHRTNQ